MSLFYYFISENSNYYNFTKLMNTLEIIYDKQEIYIFDKTFIFIKITSNQKKKDLFQRLAINNIFDFSIYALNIF